ncbi:phenylcoumaran benzylic ether reductase POP1-like [Impatiens glandulifera]|uniref:phenylcoumaran benzylic ether reductase POP1-like n=1 Tax=Impatiens glandulifera TaxID=253017 RepID=UPI001FB0654B|nr:phenylcoumaran benzylic ether reductase POP1-like [Impatiens glandulifera]
MAAATTLAAEEWRSNSRVLIIGGSGYIGKFIAEASAKKGHPTFVLIRENSISSPEKSDIFQKFKDAGISLIHGDIFDHDSLVKAIKQVDIVICAVAKDLIAHQTKIIAAIKEAGNIKRFVPSEFGSDPERNNAIEPAKSVYQVKVGIRRAIEEEGIPYTYVCSNCFGEMFLKNLAQVLDPPASTHLPTDKVVILGNGNSKVVFNQEADIGEYTIKAVDDPRTLNKTIYLRPSGNIVSLNDLATLWEKKIGKSLERIYVSEEQLLKKIEESAFAYKVVLSLCHSAFVKGDQTNFEIDPSLAVEASQLYPDVNYTSIDQYLDLLLLQEVNH